MNPHFQELKALLDRAAAQVETPGFLHDDPAAFMHAFERQDDRETAAFFAALLAWGRRSVVNAKMQELLDRMQGQPAAFVRQAGPADFRRLKGFVHRTFNAADIEGLALGLRAAFGANHSLEPFFLRCSEDARMAGLPFEQVFHQRFLEPLEAWRPRLERHITTPARGSACKRFWLFMRWMVRTGSPVDLGCWRSFSPAGLCIPLDVHVGHTARSLGLITRKTSDHKTMTDLTRVLQTFDPQDPVRYDYALFGLGVRGEVL